MSGDVIPDWIKKIKDQEDLAKAQSEAAAQRQLADSLLIDKNGPEFWKQLLKELKINVDALSEINIHGSITTQGTPDSEELCRIDVRRQGLTPGQTYINLFYSNRNKGIIRCHPMDGQGFRFELCVLDGKVQAWSEDDPAPMTAERLAQVIVQRMVAIVRSETHL